MKACAFFLLIFVTTLGQCRKVGDESVIMINYAPVTYYSAGQFQASTNSAGYFSLQQCDSSVGQQKYVEISIINPNNINENSSLASVVLEISSDPNNWNSNTVWATNYVWSASNPIIYNNVTFIYDNHSKDLWLRYKSYGAGVYFSVYVTYTNGATNEVYGQYSQNVISGATYNGNFQSLSQYVKSNTVWDVPVSAFIYFYADFCTLNPPCQDNYNVDIIVSSSPGSPFAAFDLVACDVFRTPNVSDCTYFNTISVSNQNAASLVLVSMKNDQYNYLQDGIWIGVQGWGFDNKFIFSMNVNPTN